MRKNCGNCNYYETGKPFKVFLNGNCKRHKISMFGTNVCNSFKYRKSLIKDRLEKRRVEQIKIRNEVRSTIK